MRSYRFSYRPTLASIQLNMYLIFLHSLEESQLEKSGRHLFPASESVAQRFADIKENLPLFFNI